MVHIEEDYAVMNVGDLRIYYGHHYGEDVGDRLRDPDGGKVEQWGFYVQKDEECLFKKCAGTAPDFNAPEGLLDGLAAYIAILRARQDKAAQGLRSPTWDPSLRVSVALDILAGDMDASLL